MSLDTPAPKRTRRSSKQIARDEHAIVDIARVVRSADRWDATRLRSAVDAIGDILVAAGRL